MAAIVHAEFEDRPPPRLGFGTLRSVWRKGSHPGKQTPTEWAWFLLDFRPVGGLDWLLLPLARENSHPDRQPQPHTARGVH